MELIIPCFVAVAEQDEDFPTFAEADCTLLVNEHDNDYFGIMIDCELAAFILTVSLSDGGTGYSEGDILTINQAGGSLGTVKVISVDSMGVILAVALLNEGEGYAIADGLPVTGGTGSDAMINILTVSSINRDRVDACLATSKSIRLVVTIDGIDVSNAVTGTITVNHTFNQISSFSLTLADAQYSPLVNPHIDTDVVVVIIAFVDGEEFKIFTGLVDTPKTKRTKDFKLSISGRGYGRKLLDKRMTLISVQDSAQNKYRGSVIKYLAGQAGITNINCPRGDLLITDHSFQDQTIWDMIQKECEIEGWYVRFDEEGAMQVGPKIIKTDESKYPKPDWEYGEGEFVELGFNKTSKGIINKVIVKGAIFEEEIITVNEIEVEPDEPTYEESSPSTSNSYLAGQIAIEGWTDGDLSVTAQFIGNYLGFVYQQYKFTVTYSGSAAIKSYSWWSSAYIHSGGGTNSCVIDRESGYGFGEPAEAFSVKITIKLQTQTGGGTEELEEENPEETFTSTIIYIQIKASVSDVNSIAQYGERQPQEEYTLNKPLAETEEQCKRVGENKILDSHRYTKQPDVLVNFNPLLIVGHTLELKDTKIGYSGERWLGEQVSHSFSIDGKTGAITPRTKCGCVFYA